MLAAVIDVFIVIISSTGYDGDGWKPLAFFIWILSYIHSDLSN